MYVVAQAKEIDLIGIAFGGHRGCSVTSVSKRSNNWTATCASINKHYLHPVITQFAMNVAHFPPRLNQ